MIAARDGVTAILLTVLSGCGPSITVTSFRARARTRLRAPHVEAAVVERRTEQRAPALDPFERSLADLDAIASEQTRGYRRVEVRTGELSAFEPPRVTARRGECYVLVLRLEEGASFSRALRERGAPGYAVELADRSMSGSPQGFAGPGGVFDLGCMIDRGGATLRLYYDGPLGEGRYRLEIHRRRMSARELAEERRAIEEADRAAASGASEAERRRVCGICTPEWRRCVEESGGERCRSELDACLALRGFREEHCP